MRSAESSVTSVPAAVVRSYLAHHPVPHRLAVGLAAQRVMPQRPILPALYRQEHMPLHSLTQQSKDQFKRWVAQTPLPPLYRLGERVILRRLLIR